MFLQHFALKNNKPFLRHRKLLYYLKCYILGGILRPFFLRDLEFCMQSTQKKGKKKYVGPPPKPQYMFNLLIPYSYSSEVEGDLVGAAKTLP